MRTIRLLLGLLAGALTIALAATAAGAQSVPDLVDQIDLRGYATGSGVDADVNALEDWSREHSDEVGLVVLATSPSGGTDLLADEVAQRTEAALTILVVVPFDDGTLEAGVASASVGDADLDRALDAAVDQPSRDPVVFADAFADELSSVAASGGGGLGLVVVLLIVVGIVAVGFFLLRRKGGGSSTVEAAREDLRDDLDGVANDLLELADRPGFADNDEARGHYQAANAGYLEVSESLDTARNIDALDDLDDVLELAAWHLDAAEALLEGREAPEKPDQREPWERHGGPAIETVSSGPLPTPPPPPPRPDVPPRRPRTGPRRRGMGAGMLGGVLGGILASGGGLRHTPRSRPSGASSRRRSTSRRRSSSRRSTKGRARRRG